VHNYLLAFACKLQRRSRRLQRHVGMHDMRVFREGSQRELCDVDSGHPNPKAALAQFRRGKR
jgi:hypothetical protein